MHRERVWTTYQSELPSDRLTLPAGPAVDTRHAYHLFTILVDEVRTGITRDRFLEEITAQGIGVGVHYLSIPEYSYYQEQFGWLPEASQRHADRPSDGESAAVGKTHRPRCGRRDQCRLARAGHWLD